MDSSELIFTRTTGSFLNSMVEFIKLHFYYIPAEIILNFCYSNGRAVLNKNRNLVGLIVWDKIIKDSTTTETNLTIAFLAVDIAYRKRGIARKLLRQAKFIIFDIQQRASLYLQVDQSNSAAISLYLSEGFIIIEQLNHYYGLDKHAWYMKYTG